MEEKVKDRIKKLLEQLNTGIYEKEEVMALALLSSIAGENIFLLGPPGVAKSLIARRLKYAYKDAKVFEYLMSRFSTPDEIFGPVAILKLKEENKYERITDNYLPKAEVVFLDEIWKAGPSIQNALLTILNEKKFRNGDKEEDVPIKALISASNELPEKNQGLEALWDRFLVRFVVEGIEDQENFENMITMPSVSAKEEDAKLREIIEPISDDKERNQKINEIKVPENVRNVIQVIKKEIANHNNKDDNKEKPEKQIYVSDRRWRKIIRLMRTSAFLNDREEIDLMDCFLIKHCIWNEDRQIQTVTIIVNDAIIEHGPELDMGLNAEREEFRNLTIEIEKNTSKEIGRIPVVYKKDSIEYYKLTDSLNDKHYLITRKKVDNISCDTEEDVEYFSDNFNIIGRCFIQKTKKTMEHNLELSTDNYYSRDWHTYRLKTKPIYEPYKKSPSRGDYELWNNDTNKLLSVLENKKVKADQYWETFSESFYNNSFVNKNEANEHIKTKINDVIKDIDKFMMDINEIRKKYQSIYKANE